MHPNESTEPERRRADDARFDRLLDSQAKIARGLVLLRRETAAGFARQEAAATKPPTWISRWVGGPRDALLYVAIVLALMQGDVKGVLGAAAGYVTGSARPVVVQPQPEPPASLETLP